MRTLREFELCLLCTNKPYAEIVNIYAFDTDEVKYIDKLKFVFDNHLLLDEIFLPTTVCTNCCNQLKKSYEFKKQFISATQFWSEQIQIFNQESTNICTLSNKISSSYPKKNENIRTDCSIAAEEQVGNITIVIDESIPNKEPNNHESKIDEEASSTTSFDSEEEDAFQLNIKMKKVSPKTKSEDEVIKLDFFPSSIDSSTYISDKNKSIFLCKTCNKHFANKNSLKAHLLRHTGIKPFSCKICKKKKFTYTDLKSHMLVHDDNLPFSCHNCKKSFRTKSRLETHIIGHKENRPHICEICGKGFIRPSSLRTHLISHSDEKKHQCKICQKRFKVLSSLKTHNYSHTKRSYKCKICNKVCESTGGYYFHLRTHKEKSIKCSLCDKSFYYNNKLKMHMKSHTNEATVTCSVCKKQFKSNGVLKQHLRIHTGERPYSCRVCNKTFRQSGTLSVHMRLHTGVRPYKCQLCEKAFIKSHHYKNHMKSQHGSSTL